MICILLLCHVGVEVVVGDDKVSIKKLSNGVVNGGSPGKDLGVVDIKIGVDEVDIAVDGGRIDEQVREIGAESLFGGNTVDRGKLHDLFVDGGTILDTSIEGVLALIDLEASLGGRGK